MDQFEIEHFNRTTTITVWDKVRINNLVANARLAKVAVLMGGLYIDGEIVTLAFTTLKKLKPPSIMTFTIPCERLTDQQLQYLMNLAARQK